MSFMEKRIRKLKEKVADLLTSGGSIGDILLQNEIAKDYMAGIIYSCRSDFDADDFCLDESFFSFIDKLKKRAEDEAKNCMFPDGNETNC